MYHHIQGTDGSTDDALSSRAGNCGVQVADMSLLWGFQVLFQGPDATSLPCSDPRHTKEGSDGRTSPEVGPEAWGSYPQKSLQ